MKKRCKIYECQKCGKPMHLPELVVVTAAKEHGCDNFLLCCKCYAEIIEGIKFTDKEGV